MSDDVMTAETQTNSQVQTAGAMLRAAREAAGLHIAALAVSMKVPVKKLEALEQDRLDPSLEPVFVRALAGSVCRALKIDPTPVLDKLPQNQAPRLPMMELRKGSEFHASVQNTGTPWWSNFPKPVLFVVPLLIVGIVGLLFFPEIQYGDDSSSVESVLSPQVHPPLPSPVPIATAQTVDSASTTPSVVPEVPSVAALAAVPAAVSSTVSPTSPPPLGSSVPSLLLFKAKGASWIEVVDATGAVQLRRTLSEGENIGVSGMAPLAVVVGRADAVSIEVRGKLFDLTNLAKDGVARFEVK